jgi:hypothetical protein
VHYRRIFVLPGAITLVEERNLTSTVKKTVFTHSQLLRNRETNKEKIKKYEEEQQYFKELCQASRPLKKAVFTHSLTTFMKQRNQ